MSTPSTSTTEEEAFFLDFLKIHKDHSCFEHANIHQVFSEFVEFYQQQKKKNGGKILLFNLLSKKSDYIKSRKSQFYNSFSSPKYKELTKELRISFQKWQNYLNFKVLQV